MDFVFHAVDSQEWVLNSCQWNLDSRFQPLAGFRNSWAHSGFWRPEFRTPRHQAKTSRISESGLHYTCGGYTKGVQFKVVAATVTKNYTKITIQCLLKVLISALELEVSHALQASFNWITEWGWVSPEKLWRSSGRDG